MTEPAAARVLQVLQGVLGPPPAALHEPRLAGNEWLYVKECLDSGWVSSVGAFVDRFERELAARAGVGHAVAVVNGTAALHVCLLLAGVRPGDEVLAPALTFIATINAISYCGARPHFVDSDPHTLGLDPAALEAHLRQIAEIRGGTCVNRHTGAPLRAVVPMHVFGHVVDMAALLAVAERWRLAVVEDAAEALGSSRDGRPAGSFARLAALSFNGNKITTCGGGGAVLTDDEDLARRARHLTTTAKRPHPWAFEHDAVGFNYRLPNINAALGVAQLEQLAGFVAAKRRLAETYRAACAAAGLAFVGEPAGCRSNYWLNAVLLDDIGQRDAVLAATNQAGYMTRPAWTPIHQLAIYGDCPRAALPVVEDLAARLVNLPSGAALGERLA